MTTAVHISDVPAFSEVLFATVNRNRLTAEDCGSLLQHLDDLNEGLGSVLSLVEAGMSYRNEQGNETISAIEGASAMQLISSVHAYILLAQNTLKEAQIEGALSEEKK